MAIVHGLTAGTYASTPAYTIGTRAAVLLVVFLTVYRVLTKRKVRRKARSARQPQTSQHPRIVERVAVDHEEVRGGALGDSTGRGLPEEVAAAPRKGG
jgi:hypothetical protein